MYLDFRSETDLVEEDDEAIDLKCHKFRGNTDKCWCEQEKRRLAQNGIFIQPWIVEIKIGIPKGLKPSFAGEIEVSRIRAFDWRLKCEGSDWLFRESKM